MELRGTTEVDINDIRLTFIDQILDIDKSFVFKESASFLELLMIFCTVLSLMFQEG